RLHADERLLDRVDLPAQIGRQRSRRLRAPGEGANPLDRLEDFVQPRGFEREYRAGAEQGTHGVLHLGVGDGADVAQLLRQDQLRVQPLQQRSVELVEAAIIMQVRRYQRVDLPAAQRVAVDDAA